MPKQLEAKLKREAASKGLTGERADAYTYGTMSKLGLMPGQQKVKKPNNLGKFLHPKRKGH